MGGPAAQGPGVSLRKANPTPSIQARFMLRCRWRHDGEIRVGLEEGGVESQAAWRLLHGGDECISRPVGGGEELAPPVRHPGRVSRGIATRHMIQLPFMLLASFTQREDVVRIISARKATRNERKDYEEGTEP